MKKILIVITTAFVSDGGLTSVMLSYYRHMNRDGLQIDFASTNSLDMNSELYQELKRNHSQYYCLGRRKRNVFLYFAKFFVLLRAKKYDVIHVNGNSATMVMELGIAKWLRIPIRVAHCHNSRCEHAILNKILMPFFRGSYTRAVACSKMAGEWLFDSFDILQNAIDFEKYRFRSEVRKRVRDKLNISDKFVIGTVGKINEQKNQIFFLDVLKEFMKQKNNAVFLLIGDGPDRGKLKKHIERMGLENQVIMLGMRTDVDRLLNGMDCFVLTSLWEGCPLALLEAQANGLSCISSDRVSSEGMITGQVRVVSLKDKGKWVEVLAQTNFRTLNSEQLKEIFERHKYEITKNSNLLRQWYVQ